jgi:phage repressor protein C with HTH and peptisase S24 domain
MERLSLSQVAEVEEHLLLCDSCLDIAEEIEDLVNRVKLLYDGPRTPRFHTHLPLYSLEAAAGKFGKKQMEVDPEGWVEVPSVLEGVRLTREMFVIHVKGVSMEPSIPDGSLCAFRGNVDTPYEGKVVLLEEYSKGKGSRYTVKRYHTSTHPDPHNKQDASWLHERMTLESTNPNFPSWEVASDRQVQVIGEFLFVI